jgi:hypothetical protein
VGKIGLLGVTLVIRGETEVNREHKGSPEVNREGKEVHPCYFFK